MTVKKFFKNVATRLWFIVSCILALILLILNVALAIPTVKDAADLALGRVNGGSLNSSGNENGDKDYYKKTTKSKEEAKEKGDEFNIDLAREGIVMLKNKDNAFPFNTAKDGNKVSVFGKNSVNIVYGGSGSGAVDSTGAKNLFDSLTNVGFEVNPTLKAFYENKSKSGEGRENNPTDLDSGKTVSLSTGETPYSKYTSDVKASYANYSDLALIVISRIGGEGFDLPRTSNEEGKHYLELDSNEIEMIRNVINSGFKKIALVINSGNVFELGFTQSGEFADKIDAVFFMPGTGTTGAMALGEILTGKVNPSGHTVDTFATDFTKAPSFQNFGDNRKQDGDQFKIDGTNAGFYFVDYEEGVYVGYRYYETRGEAEGEDWYKENVVYPFGYGLSYTDFSYSIDNKAELPTTLTKDKFTVKVKVKNTGKVKGKAVVQLYGSTPYIAGQIQKSSVQLVGFGKTAELEPNSEETVSVEIDPYYLASYDYKDENKDGFKGYTLDKGDYTISLRENSHKVVESAKMTLPETIKYEKDPVTDCKVENLYTGNADEYLDSDYHLQSVLSRDDFDGTFPKTPEGNDYNLTSQEKSVLEDRNPNNPETYEMPDLTLKDEDKDLKLWSLYEKEKDGSLKLNKYGAPYIEYDNPKWDALLNKISLEDMKTHMNRAAFHTKELTEIDKPRTYETDGPAGFVNFMFQKEFFGTAAYCSEVMVGQTYNQELAEEWGTVVGEEGLWGDTNMNSPYSGWYAPGINIHRSPFGGRNFEYYSEDSLFSGKMAAAQIRGTRKKGVYCFAKHFALNEQETHRQSNGDISYVTEQAMREIYLRPFEIAVKEGDCIGIMTSFNRIGLKWTGGDYRLLTTILRNEWGFRGAVIDDFNTPGYMPVKQMAYAGGDINLSLTRSWNKVDEKNANDVYVVRRCLKNMLYVTGNSNAMNGFGEGFAKHAGTPIITIIQIAVDIALPIIIVAWGVVAFILVRKKPDEPSIGN